ncbi:GFA family protein [uncultured Tateyamaria sp.]|uniref:GFA family protein n=1 Tax=uncultured Tateyamaria sp. TaxID=455651 RepID=UPI0026266924|nr:GFA family protein [uncultured Tateyamaria sp.]
MSDQLEGGCFCGAIRYAVTSKPRLKAQCHCRACQYFSGGGPNYYMLVSPESLVFSGDAPGTYRNPDKPDAVTRAFCQKCGTHLTTERPGLEELVLKVGTLDDPSVFRGPKIAIFCEEKQDWHVIPEDLPTFATLPSSA